MENGGGSPKYSWLEFHVPSVDKKGHSDRPQLRMQPRMMGQLQNVVDCRKFPYENYQQVIRHSLMKHFDWLESLEKVPSVTAQLKVVNHILNEGEFQQQFLHYYDRLAMIIDRNIAEKDPAADRENVRLVSNILAAIEGMPDGYWKNKYWETFKGRYLGLLERAPAVSLIEFEEG